MLRSQASAIVPSLDVVVAATPFAAEARIAKACRLVIANGLLIGPQSRKHRRFQSSRPGSNVLVLSHASSVLVSSNPSVPRSSNALLLPSDVALRPIALRLLPVTEIVTVKVRVRPTALVKKAMFLVVSE